MAYLELMLARFRLRGRIQEIDRENLQVIRQHHLLLSCDKRGGGRDGKSYRVRGKKQLG